MLKIDQSNLLEDPGTGDCYRACVASVLELPLRSVPHFCGNRLKDVDIELNGWSVDNWYMKLKTWAKLIGLEVEIVKNVEDWKGRDVHGGHVIAAGVSPRDPDVLHGVVMNTEEEIVHDPHPSRAGLVGPVKDYTAFYSISNAINDHAHD